MSDHKSLTELAAQKRRRAHEERARGGRYGSELAECFAGPLEREADGLLTLPGAPDVGAGGEVVCAHPAPDGKAVTASTSREAIRWVARNTLAEGATRVAEDASVRRQDLLLQPSFNALALAIDAAESIGATNSLEKMLAHQMAVAHEMAMRLANRALSYEHSKRGDQVEACRLANTVARLMSVYQEAMLALQKLRTGGAQTVTVQHVNIAPGGQAVVGNVQTGGPATPGAKLKDE